MIARSYIEGNLASINRSFLKARSQKDALLFSKLAILELCGWIEESMDDIVLRCATRHLNDQVNLKYCREDIVRRTYGFDYQRNFRTMLVRLLGLINVEHIESKVDAAKRDAMVAALSSLKQQRDNEAHTHLKGIGRTINAPSVTMIQFPIVWDGLKEFDAVIRKRRW